MFFLYVILRALNLFLRLFFARELAFHCVACAASYWVLTVSSISFSYFINVVFGYCAHLVDGSN